MKPVYHRFPSSGNDRVQKWKYVDIRKSPVMSVAGHDTPFFKGGNLTGRFLTLERGYRVKEGRDLK